MEHGRRLCPLCPRRAGPCLSNKVQAPCAPNSDRSRRRSAGPDDQQEPPCRDQTRKRIVPVHPLADPSWTAPANHRLNPTESRFAHGLNESFATQSGGKADISQRSPDIHDLRVHAQLLAVSSGECWIPVPLPPPVASSATFSPARHRGEKRHVLRDLCSQTGAVSPEIRL
jgi:hypothetical protein